MKDFLDTDILLDVARSRSPHLERGAGGMAAMETRDARHALALPMAEIEDAFQAAAAFARGAHFIVTRNLPDCNRSPVPATSPAHS